MKERQTKANEGVPKGKKIHQFQLHFSNVDFYLFEDCVVWCVINDHFHRRSILLMMVMRIGFEHIIVPLNAETNLTIQKQFHDQTKPKARKKNLVIRMIC